MPAGAGRASCLASEQFCPLFPELGLAFAMRLR